MNERAGVMKQRLALFEDYQGKSTIANPKLPDIEVFSIATLEDQAFINFMKIVHGAVIHTFTIELTKNLNEDPNELLAFGILSLREQFNSSTVEIVVPFLVDNLPETILQVVPQIGDKKKLLDLSYKNVVQRRPSQNMKMLGYCLVHKYIGVNLGK